MAKITGIEGMSGSELNMYLQSGGKFVVYQYCISVLIITFRRVSDVFFIRPGESTVSKGLPYSLLSFLLGWWGIPWGPIHTVGALITNFGGGKDVTAAVVSSLNGPRQPTANP